MIHWQPAFERTKQSICIAMYIALDQGLSQIRSGDVGAHFREVAPHGNLPVEPSQYVASPKK